MDDTEFDRTLITAAFGQAALAGWSGVSVVSAAREAGLPLDRARARFPGRAAILLRFGTLADQAALSVPSNEPSERERLFDLVMRRFDALQEHREGIIGLMRSLPADPGTALLLYGATLRSMGWLLEAAGIPATGAAGAARTHGLLAVWLYVLRAWEADDSPDLSATMAALDKALNRAADVAGWLGAARGPAQQSAAVMAAADAGFADLPPTSADGPLPPP